MKKQTVGYQIRTGPKHVNVVSRGMCTHRTSGIANTGIDFWIVLFIPVQRCVLSVCLKLSDQVTVHNAVA